MVLNINSNNILMGWVFFNFGVKFIEFIEIYRIFIDILERIVR